MIYAGTGSCRGSSVAELHECGRRVREAEADRRAGPEHAAAVLRDRQEGASPASAPAPSIPKGSVQRPTNPTHQPDPPTAILSCSATWSLLTWETWETET